MGCILACLRFKDSSKRRNKAQLKSSPVPPKTKEPLLSGDPFATVFVSEGSTCEQVANLSFEDNRDKDIFGNELKDEVKILKSCGAILETPAEFRTASEKLIAQPLNNDISSSNSSCIPDTLVKKLVWEEHLEDSEFSQNNVAGSKFGEHQSRRHNDGASKTASCVPSTRKFVLDEEQEDSSFEEQVKFLKSWGTILETPAESRKSSKKLIDQPLDKDISSSDSCSIPDTLIKNLVLEEHHDDSEFSQNSVAGSKFEEHQSRRHNDGASKTASCVPDTHKFVLDEEQEDSSFEEQVKLLKSWGTILETPAESWKASEKLIDQPLNKDISSSDSSRTPDTLVLEEHEEDSEFSQNSVAGSKFEEHQSRINNGAASKTASCVPGTPKFVLDEEQVDSSFEQHSSAGFIFGIHQAQEHDDCTSSSVSQRESSYLESSSESAVLDVSPSHDDTKGSVFFGSAKSHPEIESSAESAVLDVCAILDSHDDSKGSVCFEESAILDDSPSQDGTQTQALGGNNSPYPTPLELTDEMWTPCTVYPPTRENLRRKNAGVRNQYVYPVLNPTEKEQTPVTSSSNRQKDKRSPDSSNELDKETYSSVKKLRSLTPLSNSRWKVTSILENPQAELLSLSQWLKHPPLDNKKKYSCLERTPDVERPIFGVVALHWNEEDPSKISPKLWGGNGIPNTTTKYKEDQKVSWHATPFEERLDKALSDDKLFPRRKEISRNLVAFDDEAEESAIMSS